MEINKNGLLYKIAYGWSPSFSPSQTNLCRFFWRVVFSLLVVWPLYGIAILLVFLFINMFFLIGFFFGCHPTTKEPFAPYRKWPTIKGYRILPVYLVLFAAIAYWHQALWNALVWTWTKPVTGVWDAATLNINIGFAVVGSVVLIGLVSYGIYKFQDTDAAKLLKAYLKAKKEKMCPIVRFVDEKK